MSALTVREWMKRDNVDMRMFMIEKWYEYTEDEEEVAILHLTMHGDYVGSEIHEANYNSLKKMFGNLKSFREGSWGYGARGAGFALDVPISGRMWPILRELLEDLDAYPIIDEDEWSRVQDEWRDRAWDEYMARDFQKLTGLLFPTYWDVSGELYEMLGDDADIQNFERFETGGLYIDTEKFVERIFRDTAYEPPWDWPLEDCYMDSDEVVWLIDNVIRGYAKIVDDWLGDSHLYDVQYFDNSENSPNARYWSGKYEKTETSFDEAIDFLTRVSMEGEEEVQHG